MKRPDKYVGPGRRVLAAVAVAGVLVSCADVAADSGTRQDPAGPTTSGSVAQAVSPDQSPMVVGPDEGRAILDDGAMLVDVRTPAEFAEARIDGAVLIDVSAPTFDEQVMQLDPDGTYVVYCRTGNRSAAATARMAELGFTQIYDMGGIGDWVTAGHPVVAG